MADKKKGPAWVTRAPSNNVLFAENSFEDTTAHHHVQTLRVAERWHLPISTARAIASLAFGRSS